MAALAQGLRTCRACFFAYAAVFNGISLLAKLLTVSLRLREERFEVASLSRVTVFRGFVEATAFSLQTIALVLFLKSYQALKTESECEDKRKADPVTIALQHERSVASLSRVLNKKPRRLGLDVIPEATMLQEEEEIEIM